MLLQRRQINWMGDKDDNNNNNDPGDQEAPWRKADPASRTPSNPSVSLVGVRVTPATEDTSATDTVAEAATAENLPLKSGPEDKRHKQLSVICPQTQQENMSAFER